MNDSKDDGKELDAAEMLHGGSAEEKDLSEIRQEIARREIVLDQLRAEQDELQREFKKLSPGIFILTGDIGKLQMLDLYRKTIRQKIQKQLRKIREAELDLQRAEEHLNSMASGHDSGADTYIEEE